VLDDSIRNSNESCGHDDWALAVLSQIESVCVLHAADAVYHQGC
jgi:hypothetical protein